MQEAEDGILAGRFVVGNRPDASGNQYIYVPDQDGNNYSGGLDVNPDFATYCFDVPAAGDYKIEGFVSFDGTRHLSDSFFVQVDDQPANGYLWDTLKSNSFAADYVSDRGKANPVIVNLTAGQHIVKIHLREDGTLLDKLTLVPLNPIPPTETPVPATNTPVPTATDVPPTATSTAVPPTETPQASSVNLIISEIVDATLPGGLPKFVELTNVGNTPIDLSTISIGNYSNGGTDLGGGSSTALSGILNACESYVVSYENSDSPGTGLFFDTYGFDPDNFDLGTFINGDDVVAIFEGVATGDGSDATMIDVYGVIGVNGDGEVWDYTDGYSFRNSGITAPSSTFTPAEWTFGGLNSLETGDDLTELPLILSLTTPGTTADCGGVSPTATPGPATATPVPPTETPVATATSVVPTATATSVPPSGAVPLITEIMYDPDSAEDNWEWIEIYNPGPGALDLTGYVIDDFNGVAHSSANIGSFILNEGSAAVLYNADDVTAADFMAAWGNVTLIPVSNWGAMALNNGGDTIGIWSDFASYSGDNVTQANAIEQVVYDDSNGWPDNNNGSSVYLTNLTADNNDGNNWALSADGASTPLNTAYTSMAAGGNDGADVGSPGVMLAPSIQLLLSEVIITPTDGEFIEIHNPTGSAIDLSNVYVTDATFAGNPSAYYYNIVTGANAGGGSFSDFLARFPDGASIAPGEYQTLALAGSDDFFAEYGVTPTYELYEDGLSADGIPDMREGLAGSINNQGGLTNSGEVVILFSWDGVSDRVVDLDYVVWGDTAEAVDKTGISVDGPDADTDASAYLDDTPLASQALVNTVSHAFGNSWQRDDLTEGAEIKVGGNGSGGHDETSEDLNNTWCENPPTPNAASSCPVIGPGSDAKLIHEIQGSGTSIIFTTQVSVTAIVVGDFQNDDQLDGFYIQEEDADADADPATSEGIFVYCGSDNCGAFPDVNVGDQVVVVGLPVEFGDQSQIELASLAVVSTGNPLPTAAIIDLPVTNVADLEAFEGMRVQTADKLYVTEHFNLGRFGETLLTSNVDRQYQGTHVAAPGAPALAHAAANLLDRILLDDGKTGQNPDPLVYPAGFSATSPVRAGDSLAAGFTGVLGEGFSAYRIQPTDPVTFTNENPRPAAPDAVGGDIKVASMNVLNFFTTLDGSGSICGPTGGLDCRGADSTSEFNRQRDKILVALAAMDADMIGLVELENNATASLQSIVDGLNATAGPGTWAFVDTGTIGTDAIKVGYIYKTAVIAESGGSAILDSTVDPTYLDTKNRPVLAQTFEVIDNSNGSFGGKFTAAITHLKSKGSACDDVGDPDGNDGQGNCNGVRTAAATAMATWLATDPTGSGDADVIIFGDLNAYKMEDPITALKNAGYTDLIEQYEGNSAYSFVFGGEWGYLDYAMANAALVPQVTGTTEWHINSDEPRILDYNEEFQSAGQIADWYNADQYRASDHDVVVVGLDLDVPAPPAVASDLIISEYGEGSSNNKYIEIYNGTGATVDLSAYKIWRISNGGTWPEAMLDLSGNLADEETLIVYNPSADPTILAAGTLQISSGVINHNGDDALGLVKDGVLIDVVGTDGPDPGTGWDVAGTTNGTTNHTLVRKASVCDPNTDWTASAGTSVSDSEWVVLNSNDWSNIGTHTLSCTPAPQ
ncbi:MAG: ExeM/NucH family extracellular endonuclease [Anaerolineae bacterium]